MMALQHAWYENKKWVWLLLPLSILFFCISSVRRALYKLGVLASDKPNAFIIIVGNITVGGNGKTPTVIAIAEHLMQKGYRCGVLSRGYGGSQTNFPHFVSAADEPSLVGDEPKLMQHRLSCPVVIDPKRARGAKFLVDAYQCDVIICDDGLQHYALKRDFEIVVMDGRGLGNAKLLPMGPLRELPSRLKDVDVVLFNGQPNAALTIAEDKLATMVLEPNQWVNVNTGEKCATLPVIDDQVATAIAGIGDPNRFFTTLSKMGISCDKTIAFPDHYAYQLKDIPKGMVLMTEKDAVKCSSFAHDNCWYLQVSGNISANIYQLIDNKLKLLQQQV
ncbi:MAG: tetraacyldisaccharide 4'-kinase [Glaciecola sp.]|jgi:tetraacyldisaccharide 4'-kinase